MFLEQYLWVDSKSLVLICKYLLVALPTFVIIFLFTIKQGFWFIAKEQWFQNVNELIAKELLEDNNKALSIFLWARAISIAFIISYAVAFNLLWIILFSILAYVLQEITVLFLEKSLKITNLELNIIEKQQTTVAILYWGLVIALSSLIGSILI